MSNTTDIAITTFGCEEKAIEFINSQAGININEIPYNPYVNRGYNKILIFEFYGYISDCVGRETLEKIIKAFKEAPWDIKNRVVMIISDDDDYEYSGIYTVVP